MQFIRKIKINQGITLLPKLQERYIIEKIIRNDTHYVISFNIDNVEAVLEIDGIIHSETGSGEKPGEWAFLTEEENEFVKKRTGRGR